MKEIKLNIRNFQAKLPNDFGYPVGVYSLPKDNFEIKRKYLNIKEVPENNIYYEKSALYRIGEDKIYFSGNYSDFLLVKWFQIFKEWVHPKKVVLSYKPHPCIK